jgi:hypothetical protein
MRSDLKASDGRRDCSEGDATGAVPGAPTRTIGESPEPSCPIKYSTVEGRDAGSAGRLCAQPVKITTTESNARICLVVAITFAPFPPPWLRIVE